MYLGEGGGCEGLGGGPEGPPPAPQPPRPYLKKGFFRSRRLEDLEPVWSTWATMLMS